MFRFESPAYLYLLLVVPLLLLFAYMAWRRTKRNKRRIADQTLWQQMIPDHSPRRHILKFAITLAALIVIVLMLARPQFGLTSSTEEKNGIEVVFMVDVSNSMLAQDVQPDRLSRSKLLVSTIIDRMKNDKVALGVFAGEAYPQLPITNDYASAKLFLDNLTTGMVTLQGTNLASAIELGLASFTEKEDVGKALIIITDGEDHEEGAIEMAQKAAKAGVNIYVLGIGSTAGAQIPLADGSFLRDNSGQVVRSALNEKMCQDVATAGKGLYFHVDNTNVAQQQLQEQLSKLKQADSAIQFTHPNEQFQAVALLALVLLLVEFFIWEKKNPIWKRIKIFK